MEGLTFDTGALIALERRERRMTAVWMRSLSHRSRRTVPTAVIAEWWRGQRGPVARLLEAVDVEPLSEPLARVAGEALARLGPGPSAVDAIVMASAASRGDLVYTADVADLERLRDVFPSVRVLGV